MNKTCYKWNLSVELVVNTNTVLNLFNHMIKKSLKIPKGGNQNPYIDEEQTNQWPNEKVQKNKQRSTKHTHKTKDRETRTPLKTWLNSCDPEG